jgi:hypothetical protein
MLAYASAILLELSVSDRSILMSEKDSSQSTSGFSSKKFNALIAFFSHPLVGIVGTIASIISIPLAFYFFIASQHEPKLTYYVYPIRAPLVQTGMTSDLKVLFSGTAISGDVTAAQIEIWNSASAPIKREDVLSPILIQTENNAPILEISVRKISRPVTEISIDPSKFRSGIARIDWRILEKDDGCVLQMAISLVMGIAKSSFGRIRFYPQGRRQLRNAQKPGDSFAKILASHPIEESQLGLRGSQRARQPKGDPDLLHCHPWPVTLDDEIISDFQDQN